MVALFSPIKVGDVALQHRIAMAPLIRFRAPNHIPQEAYIEYYEKRAARKGTLLITEGTFIDARAGGFESIAGIYNQTQIDSWSKVFSKVHAKESFVFVQLWALGRAALGNVLEKEGIVSGVVSSSNFALKKTGFVPRPLSNDEIKEYVQFYVQAAKNSLHAGADGVEIHNANGYLLDQFLHENTNHRTDEYGGSIQNRARFTLEVVDALISAVGAGKVGIRLSPWATYNEADPADPVPQWSYLVNELERRAQQGNQLAYIHLIEPGIFGDVDDDTTGSNDFIRDIWTGILLKAGKQVEVAEQVTEQDPKSVVVAGRYFLTNPDLVDKLENKVRLTPYSLDKADYYTTDPYDLTTYV